MQLQVPMRQKVLAMAAFPFWKATEVRSIRARFCCWNRADLPAPGLLVNALDTVAASTSTMSIAPSPSRPLVSIPHA